MLRIQCDLFEISCSFKSQVGFTLENKTCKGKKKQIIQSNDNEKRHQEQDKQLDKHDRHISLRSFTEVLYN